MALKRIREWSQILISSLSWSCTHNESKWQFSRFVSKKCDFFDNGIKHWQIICHWKVFFTTSMNSRSLPQNKALFGLNQIAKFRLHVNTCQWSGHFRQKQRVASWKRGWDKQDDIKVGCYNSPETVVFHRSQGLHCTRPTTVQQQPNARAHWVWTAGAYG